MSDFFIFAFAIFFGLASIGMAGSGTQARRKTAVKAQSIEREKTRRT